MGVCAAAPWAAEAERSRFREGKATDYHRFNAESHDLSPILELVVVAVAASHTGRSSPEYGLQTCVVVNPDFHRRVPIPRPSSKRRTNSNVKLIGLLGSLLDGCNISCIDVGARYGRKRAKWGVDLLDQLTTRRPISCDL